MWRGCLGSDFIYENFIEKYMNNRLIHHYSMPISDNSLSYWSMHFIAVLECLANHRTLEYSSQKLYGYPIFSLAKMKGYYPNSFFDRMAVFIQNWGMQYFIVHFLNHKFGLDIVDKIKENLDDLFNIKNYKDYDGFEFYISGFDSELGKNICEKYNEIYPNNFDLTPEEKLYLERNSDFCLVLKNTIKDKSIGIFGELEGNHGEKLFQDSFWERKSNFCVIGIGAIDGKNKGYYLERYLYRSLYPKLNILFEKSNYIINDFYRVINEFQIIFYQGSQYKNFHPDASFRFLIDKIIQSWDFPVGSILNELYSYKSDSNELIGGLDNKPILLIPSIDS